LLLLHDLERHWMYLSIGIYSSSHRGVILAVFRHVRVLESRNANLVLPFAELVVVVETNEWKGAIAQRGGLGLSEWSKNGRIGAQSGPTAPQATTYQLC
jgi:hypothetical protein